MFEDTYKHKGQRERLVEEIAAKGIKDRKVLDALKTIPRHFFMDSAFEHHAYVDKPFSIGMGQTISQPFTVARLAELLELRPGDEVLEVGTGSGYQASVLMELGVELYSIELLPKLHKRAKKLVEALGYEPKFFVGDGSKGLPEHAPYDRIVVTAGAAKVPLELVEQLRIGGKMVIPIGNKNVQTMMRLTRETPHKLLRERCGGFAFVPLVGEYSW